MGRSSIPPALIELSNPTSPEAQVNALRSLKNEVVGHDQRKELAVAHGIVKPLAGILRTEARKGGKRRRGVTNGNGNVAREPDRALEWTAEDELRLQAIQVVGSLVNGGPAFVAPLLAGNILPPLLEALSPSEVPSKLVIATLRTLNQIADAVAHERPWTDSADGPLRSSLSNAVYEQIYTKSIVGSFADILSQPSRTYSAHQQLSLITRLIAKTCREEIHRKLLLDADILDILASKMALIATVDADALKTDLRKTVHEDPPAAHLPDILDSISAIIKDSHYNTARFLYSAPIQQLFGSNRETASKSYEGYMQDQAIPWDKLTPRLQTVQSKSDTYTKSWPALGSYTSATTGESYTRLPSMEPLQPASRTVVADESEDSLFVWLMFVARRGEGRTRLSACWLLALLKKFGEKWPFNDPSKTTRERHFSYLVIPLVVKMIEEANPAFEPPKPTSSLAPQVLEENRLVLERSPLVLAELVAGNKTLQNAAVEARVLGALIQILKKSFDPITTSSKPLWSPRSTTSSSQVRDPSVDVPSSTLGQPGLSAEVLHALKYRESALLAMAAMADSQDGFRKLIIEIGAAQHIIDSLVPYSGASNEPSSSTSTAASTAAKDGNPVSVLIAACKVTRSLSRSISVLRTSLIDHGVAQPSFNLLSHPSVKVQIAATEVIINLVLEVSPMRTEILEAGALRTLCEHCRSANFDLRFESLWALKHLCLGLPIGTRIQCLEELGVGWLVQILNGEPAKSNLSTPLGMGTANAAGEQVDLLNAVDDPHMDVDEDTSSEDDDNMADSIPALLYRRAGSRYTSSTNIRDRLQQIKADEQDLRLSNERDDIRLQEQALDFIRNFINQDKNSGEMIDHLLKSFGHTRFFELLEAKIRPKGSTFNQAGGPSYWNNTPQQQQQAQQQQRTTRFSAATAPSLSPVVNWAAYPSTELVISTLYILVHLANGRPQHRSLLVSQTSLMQHALRLFAHPRKDVRLPCAWFVCNLTWVEDTADEQPSRERAQSLRQLGFDDAARLLGKDPDLNIRERAKTGVEQMAKLLGEPRAGYASPATASFGGGGGEGGPASDMGRVGGVLGTLHTHRAWGRDGGV